ncbi:general secretion pathway protein GspE [Rhodanobacter thiooxydans]|uniref:General secretion pathway protein GspE n=1 Tax=Rhodanobacter thiooxydans TaxID=416169 RepID=A0A154QFS2_9GAMM|nr:GspE/PulE family protein [Rhodanobacter thiooxydans]EIL98063.1 type II secretion system protein E [Rhodanobacter thiooxydans LCS2]KZC23078.1 general secretion pathway protein GspE [Rhodanobacter thiooxydans]MCW0203591.1 GspE/PulE family protein [Rhodanobacter thiooxydans]
MNAQVVQIVPTAPALSVAQVRAARGRAMASGESWLTLLQDDSGLDAVSFVGALAGLSRIAPLPSVELYAGVPDFALAPYVECARRDCVLLRTAAEGLLLVLADPFSDDTAQWAQLTLREPYAARLAHLDEIRAFLAQAEQGVRATEQRVEGLSHAEVVVGDDELLSLEKIEGDASPVVRVVSSILYDGLKQEASDIHLKSTPKGMSVKFRIDGVLVPVSEVSGVDTAQRIISRIKVMSDLDIAERRVPQDGRFRVTARGGQVDFRVSIMPSIHGEDAVLRLLDRSALTGNREQMLKLADLAMDAHSVGALRKLVAQPYGMVLVTGPTGSGKTTTLYAAIDEINSGQENIITIEDPVEYQLPGVLQIPVNEKKGLTFARGLRSILRHDPDKIMVGEIRDEETAQIAVQAALTGHLVLTTVHANNVYDVVGRLLHMGVDPYSLASALVGVWAQRLLRVNCSECAQPYMPDAETLALSGLDETDLAGKDLRSGRGCGQCRGTGYRGRRAISEFLVMNDALRELIALKAPVTAMRASAAQQGGGSLRSAALELFYRGETTLLEVNRVTFAE